MALVACRECNHEVSDKASRCPHCGAPTSMSARGKRRLKRTAYGLLIVLVVTWAGLTALWLSGRITTPTQVADMFRIRGGTHPAPSLAPDPATSAAAAAPTASAAIRAIYQTSVTQLYQDYNANAVATQSKIGDSRVRITGTVADINQDALGHPIVTLWTGADARADMELNEDQRTVVAQLAKGDAVDIQCDHMQRIASVPHGDDCALVLLDAESRQVYLAVFLSNGGREAPAYIVGPMSQETCLSREDSLAAQLNANPRSDRIASRNCTATARESIPLDGCHLSTTMSAIPGVPTAHLWKYDCSAPAVAAARKPTESRKATQHHRTSELADSQTGPDSEDEPTARDESAPVTSVASVSSAAPASPVAVSSAAASMPAPASASGNILVASTPTTPAIAAASATPAPPAPNASVPSPAAANSVAPGAPPAAPPTPSGSAGGAGPQAPTPADDLVKVRATDPGAADHIVSYCNAATAAATDQATVAAGCRHAEASAWTRLVLNNEFPTLDDATRRKCNEPPFPDSYVAKESCARYQLHIN
jgi:hypothetical protein